MGSSYTPPVNLHSPGPIGDVTPSTIAVTTCTASISINVATGGSYNYNGIPIIIAVTASDNYFVGHSVGNLTLTGIQNCGLGSSALIALTTGNQNMAMGHQSLNHITTSSRCVAVGYNALYFTDGNDNCGVGSGTLFSNTSGTANVAIGTGAGTTGITCTNCAFIGYGADTTKTDATNSIAIGNGASVTKDNQVVIGNGSVTEVLTHGQIIASSGYTISVTSGSNKKAGTFTLVAGAATISNTSVTANSVIVVTLKTAGGTRTGNPDIVPTATTGFVATGGVADTSTYNYIILEVA